jgi:hypothetical protein
MKRMLIALVVVALAGAVAAIAPTLSAGASGLSSAEVADLQYMREEEKVARDVYTALAAKWSEATVFERIALSEQRHMDAVKATLDLYGISDPAAGKAPGEFTNAELQSLYDRLVAEGSVSLTAALGVGQTIEKTDIADLQEAMAATTNADLDRLFGNLLRGSQNHLQASRATRTAPFLLGGRVRGSGRARATVQARTALPEPARAPAISCRLVRGWGLAVATVKAVWGQDGSSDPATPEGGTLCVPPSVFGGIVRWP